MVQVACGSFFTLALTDDGQVFIFGLFHLLNALPVRLHNIGDSRAVAVACTLTSFFVLLENGQLYVWNKKFCVQMRISNQRFNSPIVTKQVVCDDNRCWALTDNGQIFVSQLHLKKHGGFSRMWPIPIEPTPEFGRVVEIEASGDRFVCRFDDGKVRAWQMHNLYSSPNNKPLSETNPSGFIKCGPIIDEAFAPKRMCRPLELISYKTPAEKLGLILNDLDTADVCLQVGGRPIWAHKAILMRDSKNVTAILQPGWVESKKIVLIIRKFDYNPFKEFFKYLYTEDCDLTVRGLGEVAEFYGHPELRSRCRSQQFDDSTLLVASIIIILFALLYYCYKY